MKKLKYRNRSERRNLGERILFAFVDWIDLGSDVGRWMIGEGWRRNSS